MHGECPMLGVVGGETEINLEEKERRWCRDRGDGERQRKGQSQIEREANLKKRKTNERDRDLKMEQNEALCDDIHNITEITFLLIPGSPRGVTEE